MAALGVKTIYFSVKPLIPSVEFRVKAGIFRSLQSLEYGLEQREIEVQFQADIRLFSSPLLPEGP